jgi:hypothetical protein
MRQVETSRTVVFDAPRRARAFVEALVADNLDLGRPDSVDLIFIGKHERRGRPGKEPLTLKTSVVTHASEVRPSNSSRPTTVNTPTSTRPASQQHESPESRGCSVCGLFVAEHG